MDYLLQWLKAEARNIYYQYPELFGKQSYVDKLVDDISFTLHIRRNDLNIVRLSQAYRPLTRY